MKRDICTPLAAGNAVVNHFSRALFTSNYRNYHISAGPLNQNSNQIYLIRFIDWNISQFTDYEIPDRVLLFCTLFS